MFYLPGQCVASILQDKLSKSKSIEDRHISLGYGLLPLGEEDVRVVIPGTLIQHSAQAFSILAGNQKVVVL